MMLSNKNRSTEKLCITVCGGILTACMAVSGYTPLSMNNLYFNPKHEINYCNPNSTYIHKSFTVNHCITHNQIGYSNNNNNGLGIENMITNNKTLKKLEAIATLQDNWNGHNAKAFSEKLITKAKNIITFLDIQPEIFPTACSSLQLEYDKTDGSHMEIELFENEEAEIFLIDADGNEQLTKISANIEEINKAVNNFYG